MKVGPRDKLFGLDMAFADALERFLGTAPCEAKAVAEAERSKRETLSRPPQAELGRLSGDESTDALVPRVDDERADNPEQSGP